MGASASGLDLSCPGPLYAASMKERASRRILHVDLDPFFVSVERSLDPSLRDRPVVVGGGPGPSGLVAAASTEARASGVRAGLSLAEARRLCPEAVVRPGDLEAYARVSDEVTALLLSASRRVERPSTDEAYVDLTPEHPGAPSPVPAVEVIKDELHRRLGLDASFGLASSRLAARVASSFSRPRGFVVVLPGYEMSFLAGKPVSFIEDLPPHLESALERLHLHTLGELAAADPKAPDRRRGPGRRPPAPGRGPRRAGRSGGPGRTAALDPGAGHRARPAQRRTRPPGRGRRPGGAGLPAPAALRPRCAGDRGRGGAARGRLPAERRLRRPDGRRGAARRPSPASCRQASWSPRRESEP